MLEFVDQSRRVLTILFFFYFSAAHCVTDNSGKKVATEEVLIAVGKYYNKYKDPRDTQDQYSKV